jgi:hypothetical protein
LDTDRPPLAGVVGRESAKVRLEVIETVSRVEWEDRVDGACLGETMVHTEEWNGSNRIGQGHGRVPRTVDHSGPKWTWALDADDDGVRAVHCHTRGGWGGGAELPAAVPRREPVVPGAVRGGLPMGLQPEGSDG